ncbi:hypothetical protein FQN55_003113 [Onygenales sp. PD_40]|nr:hypothetical protein FQN55_003113 [Onygenales sp. PD_40]
MALNSLLKIINATKDRIINDNCDPPVSPRTATEFLEERLAQLRSHLRYVRTFREDLYVLACIFWVSHPSIQPLAIYAHLRSTYLEIEVTILQKDWDSIRDELVDAVSTGKPLYQCYFDVVRSSAHRQFPVIPASIRDSFGQQALGYYKASRMDSDGVEMRFCHVFGWFPAEDIRVVAIVPLTLESEELAYALGVGHPRLYHASNSMSNTFSKFRL